MTEKQEDAQDTESIIYLQFKEISILAMFLHQYSKLILFSSASRDESKTFVHIKQTGRSHYKAIQLTVFGFPKLVVSLE